VHLEHGDADGAARFFHHHAHQLILAAFHDVCCFEEDAAPHSRRAVGPLGKGGLGGFDGAPRVFALAGRHTGVQLACIGVKVVEVVAVRGINPLAADVHLILFGHFRPSLGLYRNALVVAFAYIYCPGVNLPSTNCTSLATTSNW
jgi:hypothetical protein